MYGTQIWYTSNLIKYSTFGKHNNRHQLSQRLQSLDLCPRLYYCCPGLDLFRTMDSVVKCEGILQIKMQMIFKQEVPVMPIGTW